MPPASSAPGFQSDIGDAEHLSDQNVAILYEIVQDAETYTEAEAQPFRALFAAYDAVLPRYEIDPKQDQIYLRFLFELGDKRGRHESLFQSFERLLRELDIELEFSTSPEGSELDLDRSERIKRTYGLVEASETPRPSSVTSLVEFRADQGEAKPLRPHSSASVHQRRLKDDTSKQEFALSGLSSPKDARSKPASRRLAAPRSRAQEDSASRQALLRENHRSDMIPGIRDDTQRSIVAQKQGMRMNTKFDIDTIPVVTTRPVHSSHGRSQPRPGPSSPSLNHIAVSVANSRARKLARHTFIFWRRVADDSREGTNYLESVAQRHDSRMLKRQALETWRNGFRARQEAWAKEIFYADLEQQAVKSWNSHILERAYTHWRQMTRDELEQRALSRRHILSLKYFHAWHDITVENQKSVEYCVRKRYLSLWKSKLTRLDSLEIKAAAIRTTSLLKACYWKWFWTFCDRQAPEWYAKRTVARHFLYWDGRVQRRKNLLNIAALTMANNLKRAKLIIWLSKVRVTILNQRLAAKEAETIVVRRAFDQWSRYATFSPHFIRLLDLRDWRIAGETFSLVLQRMRLEKSAEQINRLRLLRNVYSLWNENMRVNFMRRRIVDRCSAEALYKWLVKERGILLDRLRQHRLCDRYFVVLRSTHHQIEERRALAAKQMRNLRDHRIKHAAYKCWRDFYEQQNTSNTLSFEFMAPKVAHDALMSWRTYLSRYQIMIEQAQEARHRFLLAITLNKWRKTLTTRQEVRLLCLGTRLESNRAQVTAKRLLNLWHMQYSKRAIQAQTAKEQDSRHFLRLRNDLFQQWSHTQLGVELQILEATRIYESHLMQKYMDEMLKELQRIWSMRETSDFHQGLRAQKTAFTFLRQVRLKQIEHLSQKTKADNLRANLERRHIQGHLSRWREKLATRSARKADNTDKSDENPVMTRRLLQTTPNKSQSTGKSSVSVNRSQLPVHINGSALRPLPGYLSTPSKRAERARALIHATPTTSTPFLSRLRANVRTEYVAESANNSKRIESVLDEDEDEDVVARSPDRTQTLDGF